MPLPADSTRLKEMHLGFTLVRAEPVDRPYSGSPTVISRSPVIPGSVRLTIHPELLNGFEGLRASLLLVDGVEVRRRSKELEAYKAELIDRMRDSHQLEALKDEPRIRAYRDFFLRAGIDPTKVRPASEALLRRVLQGKQLPTINTLVDAYNLASMVTRVALAAFDNASLKGDLIMRHARHGEEFLGIGMDSPISLRGKEIVVEDDLGLVAVYPYRDADRTKVTPSTTSAVLMVCGVPGLPEEALREAEEVSADLITRFCGGKARLIT